MMLFISKPTALSALTADSRPGPGPLTRTSRFFMPYSSAARPAFSAATWAANGVLFLEPRNPAPPAVAQHSAFPCRSLMVMIVLLKDAWMWAMPSLTVFFTFFFALLGLAMPDLTVRYFLMGLRGPLRVLALVRVRWPRSGRPRLWRMPRETPMSISRLMFIDTALRRSPSTANFATSPRSLSASSSVRSLTRVVRAMQDAGYQAMDVRIG